MGTEVPGGSRSPSEAVVHEVAEETGEPPEELNPPLFAVVDPDALDTLFRGDTGRISFDFHGYTVTVDHAGRVDLTPSEGD